MLDEPTSGLDPSAQIEFRNIMVSIAQNEHKTVLLSSHNLDEVQRICNCIALLNNKVSLNLWVVICTYVAIPVVYFCLSLLMNLVGLMDNVTDAAVIGIIFVSGVSTVMINLVACNTISADSWVFLFVLQ